MSVQQFASGVVLELDTDDWSVTPDVTAPPPQPQRVTRGGLPRTPVQLGGRTDPDVLSRVLAEQGLERVDGFSLTPSPTRQAAASDPRIRVAVGADEHAVVLVEQEGVHRWVLPEQASTDPKLRGAPSYRPRELVFQVRVAMQAARQRGSLAASPLHTRVFRFAARAITPVAIGFLERRIEARLVDMSQPDPRMWKPIDELADRGSRPRVLLFIHGTFSSTVGSYHGLAATVTGRDLLTWARGAYDEVLGYDHPTLSVEPQENARDLLLRLARRYGDAVPRIDIVAYSRGGLVARTLVQQLLPVSDWRPEVARLVMIGCTNGGTRLAEPENWRRFVDLQTTLAVAAVQAVSAAFSADLVGAALSGAICSLGALIKHLVLHAIDDRAVPGLAAMRPRSPLVAALAEEPWPTGRWGCQCYVVRSEFEPEQISLAQPGALALGLRDRLVDLLADGLMGAANDLVVDTEAMTPTLANAGGVVRDTLDFGANGWVHHLCYFTHDRTAAAIRGWLAAEDGAVAAGPAIDDAIWVFDVNDSLADLRQVWSRDRARAVLLREHRADGPAFHVLSAPEAGRRIAAALAEHAMPGRVSLVTALAVTDSEAVPALAGRTGLPAVDRPTPVFADGRVIGLVRPAEPLTGPRLAEPMSPRETTRGPKHGTRGTSHLESLRGAPPAQLELRAELPATIVAGEQFELLVLLARELLATGVVRTAIATASAAGDPLQSLRISVSPRRNLEFAEPSFCDRPFPAPDAPLDLGFRGRAIAAGPAEAWVFVRQGGTTLATLMVRATVVATAPGPSPPQARAHLDFSVELGATAGPLFTLRVFEVAVGTGLQFHCELEAVDKGLRIAEKSEISDVTGYVRKLYADIESRWVASNKDARAFQRELRAYGANMFRSLLPRRLQDELWRHQAAIRDILVLSTETYVPWEVVHLCDPATGTPADSSQFLAQKGLVRWLHNVPVQPQRLVLRPGRLRHVVPTYPGEWALPATADEAALLAELGSEPLHPANAEDLYQLLERRDAVDLLHFAGHGEADPEDIDQAGLLMAGYHDGSQWSPDRARAMVIRTLAAGGTVRPFVFLNACQVGRQGRSLGTLGGFASAFLSRGAGVFVAPLWSVGDHPAFTFGAALYRELLVNGKHLAAAVTDARNTAASAAVDPTWLAYAVYGHHDAQVEYTRPSLAASPG